jgi:hypothetical protein
MNILRLFLAAAVFGSATLIATAQTAGQPAPAPVAPPITPAMKPVDWKSDPAMTEYAKQAGNLAIEQWVSEFLSKQLPAKRYAVFPVGSDLDDGYFTLQVRNQFASRALGTDYSLYTREDPEWQAIVEKEMKMGYEREGMMQEETVQKWGRENGVQGAVRGRITGVYLGSAPSKGGVRMADDAKVLQVRVALQAFEVETGRLLWGGEKVGMVQLPDESLVVPGTKRQWILYGAAALGGLVLLVIVLRVLKSANRPR